MDLIGQMAKKPKRSEHIRVGERVTIYQSGSRRIYTADFFYQGHRTRSLRTSNRKIAVQKAMLIDAQLVNEAFVLDEEAKEKTTVTRTRVQKAIEDFLEYHRVEGNRHRTVRRYEGILTEFLAFAEKKRVVYLVDVNLPLIDAYRAERNKVLSPRSMHNEGRLLKCFLAWCEERELIARTPLYRRKFRCPQPKLRKAPSLAQVNLILQNASTLRMPHFAMLAFAGMRSGESRNLLDIDVDFDGNWIYIRSRPGFETKNGEDRKVPLHPRLRKILEALTKRRRGWFFRALPSNRYPKGDHHINVKRVNEDFKNVLTQLEIPAGLQDGFVIHSLRRFFRTSAVNAGVPERVVDLWIGHCDRKQMGTIYYDLADEESQKFMLKVPFCEDPHTEEDK